MVEAQNDAYSMAFIQEFKIIKKWGVKILAENTP